MLLKIISWNPFLVCNERSVLSNNQQSQFPILPAATRKVPLFYSIHSGDTWPNKGSIYLQGLWGPRDHSSTGPRWERVMTWNLATMSSVGSGTRGKLDTKFEIGVFFDANKFVFRPVAAFLRTFQLPADRDVQTRLNKNTFHDTTDRFRRYFPFFYSVFLNIYICFLFFLLRFLRAASPSSGRGGT